MRKRPFKNIFKTKKKAIILGIHGLGNKPPYGLLRRWWKDSLKEGLSKINGTSKNFDFRMIYWADIVYPEALDPRTKDPDNELYIEEPYIAEPIPSPAIRNTLWHKTKMAVDTLKESIFLSKNGLANFRTPFNFVLRKSFKDLAAYYGDDGIDDSYNIKEPVKEPIRNRLKDFLIKHKNKRIMLIGHSMGSIIAYDVLHELQNQVNVEVFVSLGSPLGLPILKENLANEHYPNLPPGVKIPTPNNINYWFNFSDKEDHFAVFNDLSEYYGENDHQVGPRDISVINDYKDWVTNNAHKSFGYLRTPEVAQSVANFLKPKKSFWNLLIKKVR